VDDYTFEVEGPEDLPDDIRAQVWLSHVVKLAPSWHPIHRSEAVETGHDLGY
jgi:hypothetical protein